MAGKAWAGAAWGGGVVDAPVWFSPDVIFLSGPGASLMLGAERRCWWLGEYQRPPHGQVTSVPRQVLRTYVADLDTNAPTSGFPRMVPFVNKRTRMRHRPTS